LIDVKQKMESLTNEFHTISAKIYSQAAAQRTAGGSEAQGSDSGGSTEAPRGNVVDADYEVVDDETK
ncbi:MAG: molecular chaperone DnaK, partial [Clostridiales Family XIII bacterium]|jgi:molecular chaperone DnaK|nr:molecular chaperone DnaK [Clostridiales Family XIII bacterium]